MLCDYEEKYYRKMSLRYRELCAHQMEKTHALAQWKEHIAKCWDNIQVESIMLPSKATSSIEVGIPYESRVVLDLGTLTTDEIGVEILVTSIENNHEIVKEVMEYKPIAYENGKGVYKIKVIPDEPGQVRIGVRVFPKHPLLPHRQDFALVKWL